MAVRDVNLYKFIGRALKHKFTHPEATGFGASDLGYPSMEYGSIQNQNSIFGRIYNTFITLSKDQHLNLNPYLNLEDREILERLYLNLKKDPNLKFLDNPDSVLKDSTYELSDQYYQDQLTAAEQAEPVSGMADTGGKPVTAMAGGISLPSAPFLPRIIHKVEQTKPPDTFKGAVTAKAEKLAQESPATTPTQTPSIKTPAFKTDLPPLNQSVKTSNPQPIPPQPNMSLPRRLNFSAFKPTAFSINTVKNFTSPAGIFFKKNSGRIAGGLGQMAKGIGRTIVGPVLTGTYNLLGKAGTGGINVFARLSNQAGGGGTFGRGSFVKGSSKKIALAFLGALLLFGIGAGLLGGLTGTTPTGEASPIGGGSTGADISSCKFTRSDQGSPAQFKSSTLLNYIQEAAQKSSIPPVVLASFIRVESPSSSNMSNDQIINYSASCAQSPTGALGIMQIQPPGTTSARGDPASCDDCIDAGAKLVGKTVSTMTRQDYCDPRTSILVGAGWILKKMSKLGYGDGTKWDAGWTNNKTAITALVNTYYGCLKYGSADDTKTDCADPGRKYSYADDVSTSIQNCQVQSPSTPIAPPASGDYVGWIKSNFNIDVSELPAPYPQLAYEVLSLSLSNGPKFQQLIKSKPTSIHRTVNTSHITGSDIHIKLGSDQTFWKQNFIHELGHRIKGSEGNPSPACNGMSIESAERQDGGALTYYAQFATPANVYSPICNPNPASATTKADEDFAESVSYYINRTTPEMNYGAGCGIFQDINPYDRVINAMPAHKAYGQCLLGP